VDIRGSGRIASRLNKMEAFLCLAWPDAHNAGQHVPTRGRGMVEVARDVVGEQFDAYFCSTTCLRAFLNGCADTLERQLKIGQSGRRRRVAV